MNKKVGILGCDSNENSINNLEKSYPNILKNNSLRMCEPTDFAMIRGILFNEKVVIDGVEYLGITSPWITSISNNDESIVGYDDFGRAKDYLLGEANYGIRPCLPIDNFYGMPNNGLYELVYGEYPQSIVNSNYGLELEEKYLNGELEKTGKVYEMYPYDQRNSYEEYVVDGNKFIRCFPKKITLLDDELIHMIDSPCWVEVEPITWLVDNTTGTVISRDILISGIPYSIDNDTNYDNSEINKYLEKYFLNEIKPSLVNNKKDNKKTL